MLPRGWAERSREWPGVAEFQSLRGRSCRVLCDSETLRLIRAWILTQHHDPRSLDSLQHFLVQLELHVGRKGGVAVDDLGDLSGVVRGERKAFTGLLDLAEAGDQLFFEIP